MITQLEVIEFTSTSKCPNCRSCFGESNQTSINAFNRTTAWIIQVTCGNCGRWFEQFFAKFKIGLPE